MTTPPLANWTSTIGAAGAFEIWERAMALEAQGREVIHLEIGEPDFDTPLHIIKAAHRSMLAGRTRYESSAGSIGLRNAIVSFIKRTRGADVDVDQVMVTHGVKGTLFAALATCLNPGDEVLIPDPGLPGNREISSIVGATPVPYPLLLDDGFLPNIETLQRLVTDKTRAIILNYPSNPTGSLFPQDTLEALADFSKRNNLWVLADEIYYQLYFTEDAPPSIYNIDGMPERTILMDGFSKSYAMTGWRLGFGIWPKAIAPAAYHFILNNVSGVAPFIMDAGEAALNGPQDSVEQFREAFKQRCEYVSGRLADFGIKHHVPDAGMYIMLDMRHVDNLSELNYKLLNEGVALLPGTSMGAQGEGLLRLAFVQELSKLEIAMEKIGKILG